MMMPENSLWTIECFTNIENRTYGVGFWEDCGDSCVSFVVGGKTCNWALVLCQERGYPYKGVISERGNNMYRCYPLYYYLLFCRRSFKKGELHRDFWPAVLYSCWNTGKRAHKLVLDQKVLAGNQKSATSKGWVVRRERVK